VAQVARRRARGAGEPGELAGAEQRGLRRHRICGKQRRQLDQAAAARHCIDDAGAERGREHERDLRRHVC